MSDSMRENRDLAKEQREGRVDNPWLLQQLVKELTPYLDDANSEGALECLRRVLRERTLLAVHHNTLNVFGDDSTAAVSCAEAADLAREIRRRVCRFYREGDGAMCLRRRDHDGEHDFT